MTIKERAEICWLITFMQENPDYCKRLGLENKSEIITIADKGGCKIDQKT